MSKVLLVDSSYLMFRSYYAYPHLSKGEVPTGAIFGFVKTIYKLVKDFEIDYIFFAKDLPKPTWRHRLYSEYKAGRKEPDEAMVKQFPLVDEWSKLITNNVLEKEGYEADDIIKTVADDLCARGEVDEVIIFSADRDLYQLFTNDKIKFAQGDKLFGQGEFVEKYGVEPSLWVDYKTLVGDASDNLIGVNGVGPKTASKILSEIGNLDKVFSDEDTENKTILSLREKIKDNKEKVFLTRKLAELSTVPGLVYNLDYH